MDTSPGDAVAHVRDSVAAGGLLQAGRVVVLLSGGRDSVCLLDVAFALRGAAPLAALHVNYGLREAAAEEQRHCAALCEALGVPLRVVEVASTPGVAGPPARGAGNVQAWAREVRYRAAGELVRELSGEGEGDGGERAAIASAHTASDQVETILYRLAASPGRRALLGMAPSDRTEFGERLIRPLLGVTREHTTAYCEQRGLRWCDDESNSDLEYARARVRAELVPALRAVHPAAESNVLRTAQLLREEAAVLDELVSELLGGADSVALGRLASLPPALARLVVVRLAERAVGRLVPQAGARVEELLALARRGGRAELHLGGRAGAVIEAGRLRVVELPPRDGGD